MAQIKVGDEIEIKGVVYVVGMIEPVGENTRRQGYTHTLGLKRPKGKMHYWASIWDDGSYTKPIAAGY